MGEDYFGWDEYDVAVAVPTTPMSLATPAPDFSGPAGSVYPGGHLNPTYSLSPPADVASSGTAPASAPEASSFDLAAWTTRLNSLSIDPRLQPSVLGELATAYQKLPGLSTLASDINRDAGYSSALDSLRSWETLLTKPDAPTNTATLLRIANGNLTVAGTETELNSLAAKVEADRGIFRNLIGDAGSVLDRADATRGSLIAAHVAPAASKLELQGGATRRSLTQLESSSRPLGQRIDDARQLYQTAVSYAQQVNTLESQIDHRAFRTIDARGEVTWDWGGLITSALAVGGFGLSLYAMDSNEEFQKWQIEQAQEDRDEAQRRWDAEFGLQERAFALREKESEEASQPKGRSAPRGGGSRSLGATAVA